jgi:hypothetical protein
MATGIPCVVSTVGVNVDLVDHGRTGFLATTEDDWINFLERLINDEVARIKMGEAGRKKLLTTIPLLPMPLTFFLSLHNPGYTLSPVGKMAVREFCIVPAYRS